MTRKLKALGLSLMAVGVLGAVGAQGAAAVNHSFELTEVSSADLTGVLIKHPDGTGPHHVIKSGAATVTCGVAVLTGTHSEKTKGTAAASPTMSECKVGSTAATVTNEGCETVFYGETTEDPHTKKESGTVERKCSPGKSIVLSIPGCKVNFGSQAPVHGVTYTNEGSAPTGIEVTVHAQTTKFTTNKGVGCVAAGFPASGEGTDATTLANFTVRAYATGTNHTFQVGFHVL